MLASTLLSILSGLLSLTVAAPNLGHRHAHAHRDAHGSVERAQDHAHALSHHDTNHVLTAHNVRPRIASPPGCNRKPKASGTGKPSAASTGHSGLPGGVFLPNTAVVAVTPLTTSKPTNTTSTVTASITSSLGVLETKEPVAKVAVATTASAALEVFQKSHTLVTSYSATPVPTTTKAEATTTVDGGDSGLAPAPTGDANNLIVDVHNKMKCHLTYAHAMNANLPQRVQTMLAGLTHDTMAPGAKFQMVYPAGWAGNMVFAKAATSDDDEVYLDNGSLIEGSFVAQMGDLPVADIDVSYV